MSNEYKLKVKVLNCMAKLPSYSKEGDSGFDLSASEEAMLMPGDIRVIQTGLAFEIQDGMEIQIRPRSGLSSKTKLRVIFGTVDSGYRGEVGIIVENTGHTPYTIKLGDRIAQGVLAPVNKAIIEEVVELTESNRGSKGYGSSGV